MTLSLDGYFQGPDHDLSWHLVDEELHAHFNEQLANNGASIAGRVSGSEDGSIRAAILAGVFPAVDPVGAAGPGTRVGRDQWY